MNNARNLVALTLGVLLMATATWSEVPEKMNYQVMLTDNSDQPLANESVQLVFSIYNVDAGGDSLWTETHDVVTNSIGVVSVVLGTYNPLSLGFEGPLWLQVAVDGEIMSPRRELTSAPYALSVGAGVSGDGHSLDADDGSPVDAVYVDSDGTVGFGSSTSDGKAEFYTAGGENPSIKLSAGPTYGGLIELYEESGAQYGGLEPDFDGTGGFLWIDNGSGWSGFYVDGNAVSGNAQVGIFGTASSTYFSTYSTGNDAVLLPMNAVSGLEILDEPGAASAAHSGLYYLTGSIDALASSAITTPAAGYVLAMATASVVVNHTGGAISSCTFGVSSTASSFPTGGQRSESVPSSESSSLRSLSVSVQWLFEVATAGTHTFYFLGEESYGDWTAYGRNLALVYIPTAYGMVYSAAPPLSHPEKEAVEPGRALTEADIAAKRVESIAFNDARIERELAEMEAKIAEIRASMGNNK